MYNFTPEEYSYFLELEQGVKDIEAYPEHWNQRDWHCGTSHCLAGFCDLRRANLIDKIGEDLDNYFNYDNSPFANEYPYYGVYAYIFDYDNTLDDIKRILEDIRETGFK